MQYGEFVQRKLSVVPPTGIAVSIDLRGGLFPHQDALTQWAIKRGRCFVGVELKESYFKQAAANLEAATRKTLDLFSAAAA